MLQGHRSNFPWEETNDQVATVSDFKERGNKEHEGPSCGSRVDKKEPTRGLGVNQVERRPATAWGNLTGAKAGEDCIT